MSRRPRPLDVAIVGMACRFPGAGDLFAYWENVLADRPSIRDIPTDRGFDRDEPIAFDLDSIGIMSRTVGGGEPEPFLVRDAARSALADADMLDRMPDRDRVVVVIGRGNGFARASSAVDLGARALVERRADLALVGGVSFEADADFSFVLSKSGNARPFCEDGDGDGMVMVPGEGVGIVVLKRLRDAEHEGDRVYAVLKGLGIGIAGDGQGAGLAAPDARGHLRAIRRAYRRSGIDPATVGYIERHGSGVPASDRAELRALRLAFPPRPSGVARVLGAVSALIGHAMPAGGMAGLIKTALCLHHRMLPASAGADRPHRLLRDSGMRLNSAARPWISESSSPRRAGVNAFGFAGINAHAILEEHKTSADGVTPGAMTRWPSEAILLGGEDRAALAGRVKWLAKRLRARPDVNLKDVAATLARDAAKASAAADSRLGLVVESIDDLIARLDAVSARLDDPRSASIRDARGAYFWENPPGRDGGLAFLFPGEGSQYPGMLADLCPHFPEVRVLFDSSDRLARESGAIAPPSAMLFGGEGNEPSLWESGTAVNLVLSSQWALHGLLRKLGLRPSAVVGHSSGEFLALAAAGAFPVDRDLEERFNALAAVFADLNASGVVAPARLVGVATNREKVDASIAGLAGVVTVAVDNCPHQVVLAGPHEAVGVVVARLRGLGVLTEDLPFGRAYHTTAFAPAIGPIRDFFEAIDIAPLTTPLYSCCSAGRFPADPAEVRRLTIAQWTHPVEFRRTIDSMHADGLRVFVDVGARGNLAGFVEDTLRGKPSFAVAANLPKRSGLTQINHLVASLFAQGISLTPDFLFARRRPNWIDLDAPTPASVSLPAPASGESLAVGSPESRLSEALADRPRKRAREGEAGQDRTDSPACEGGEIDHPVSTSPVHPELNDEVMLSYLETMNAFLRTQRDVMEGFLDATISDSAPRSAISQIPETAPGPWAGEVVRLEPFRSVEAVITLDAAGDSVAEHHTFGGRRVSIVDPTMKGLPVLPFTVMAEMLAQVAARIATGRVFVGFREVRARRWIRYEDQPIALAVVAEADPDRPGEIRAALFNRGKSGLGDAPEVEGVVVFGDRRDEAPAATARPLVAPEPSRFDARSMYAEQWLFHGPALQAVSEVGPIDDGGIDGALRVLPRRGLYRDDFPRPISDPIVLDSFTHLLGLWGLDRLAEGDVVFPLRLGRLDVFGDDPPEGTDCPCRIRVTAVERFTLTADAEILRPDGRVWMRLTDWEDWRFHWPSRYRDVFRIPERILLGEPLVLPDLDPREAVAVWLEPPGDMGRPVWRDVLEQTQISPEERDGPLRPTGHEGRRALRLWGRIAAKEAARRLWRDDGKPPVFPADFSILPDSNGRPVLHSRLEPNRDDMPAVSIAHTEGVAVAIASRNPWARLGIDVETIVTRAASFESAAFSTEERSLLDLRGGDRAEWLTRFWSAKEAAAKATGLAMSSGPLSVEVVAVDVEGKIDVRLGAELAAACPDLGSKPLAVYTERRGNYIWAGVVVDRQNRRPTGRSFSRAILRQETVAGWNRDEAESRPQFLEADA